MAKLVRNFGLGILGVLATTGGSCDSHPPAAPRQLECHGDEDCHAEGPCHVGRCHEGICRPGLAPPATRCPMTLEWAQRQADLHVIEKNQLGVCWEGACIPRIYCAEKCGERLAKTIEPMVKPQPCFSRECEGEPLHEEAVQIAYQGLRECASACGYPKVGPPPAERVPRPKAPPNTGNGWMQVQGGAQSSEM